MRPVRSKRMALLDDVPASSANTYFAFMLGSFQIPVGHGNTLYSHTAASAPTSGPTTGTQA